MRIGKSLINIRTMKHKLLLIERKHPEDDTRDLSTSRRNLKHQLAKETCTQRLICLDKQSHLD